MLQSLRVKFRTACLTKGNPIKAYAARFGKIDDGKDESTEESEEPIKFEGASMQLEIRKSSNHSGMVF